VKAASKALFREKKLRPEEFKKKDKKV